MTDEPGQDIARRDEMLELLYWFEGEGLGASATLAGMTRFLAHPEEVVRATLADLRHQGYVIEHPGTTVEFRLTDTGRREAARRFADEFSSLITQGHGECNDPTCDCHTNPEGAAECHANRAAGGHKH